MSSTPPYIQSVIKLNSFPPMWGANIQVGAYLIGEYDSMNGCLYGYHDYVNGTKVWQAYEVVVNSLTSLGVLMIDDPTCRVRFWHDQKQHAVLRTSATSKQYKQSLDDYLSRLNNPFFGLFGSNSKTSERPDQRWNGTCTKCGKNVYTGFASIEHDGQCM